MAVDLSHYYFFEIDRLRIVASNLHQNTRTHSRPSLSPWQTSRNSLYFTQSFFHIPSYFWKPGTASLRFELPASSF